MYSFPKGIANFYCSQQHFKCSNIQATYIHNCLKNGETPKPGPVGEQNNEVQEFSVEVLQSIVSFIVNAYEHPL